MANENFVILIGRLGKDPETGTFPSGKTYAKFTLAQDNWRRKNAEGKTSTNWHRIACYIPNVTGYIEKHLRKGDVVYVQGELEYTTFPDKHHPDRNVTLTEIVVSKVERLSRPRRSENTSDDVAVASEAGFPPMGNSIGTEDISF